MNKKRFIYRDYEYDGFEIFDTEQEIFEKDGYENGELSLIPMTNRQVVDCLNEQDESIKLLTEKGAELSMRNIELNDKVRELQNKIDMLCEIYDYGDDKSIQKMKEYKNKDGTIEELKAEDKRLNNIIIDLHDELRTLNRKIKQQQEIIIQYKEIIECLEIIIGELENK